MNNTTHSPQWGRIERATTALVLMEPFFAALLFRMRVSEAPVGTACTDGRSLLIDPEFSEKLEGGQLLTLLAHEVGHPAMGHLWRLKNYPHKIANIAADHEINWLLEECNERARNQKLVEPFPFPPAPLKDPRFRGMAAELIAQQLMKEAQSGGGDGDSDDGALGGSTFGEFTQPQVSEAEFEKLKQEWEVDVINAAKAAKAMGRCPASVERLVEGIVNPKKSWKELLKEFVRSTAHDDYSWSRASRRYAGTGFILPSLFSQRVGTLVYFRDTSGSMVGMEAECNAELQQVLDEVCPEKVFVIDCDTKVAQCVELQEGDTIENSEARKMKGGGGTAFQDVWDKVGELVMAGEEISCIVGFTDGYADWGEDPGIPILWAMTTNTEVPFGKAIRLNE